MKAMKRCLRLCLGLVALLLFGAVLLLPAVRWRIVGWVKGEAFYQGRPTSFWSDVIVNAFPEANRSASKSPVDPGFPHDWLQAVGLFSRSSSLASFDLVGTPDSIPVAENCSVKGILRWFALTLHSRCGMPSRKQKRYYPS
jgi:hypothetical protein